MTQRNAMQAGGAGCEGENVTIFRRVGHAAGEGRLRGVGPRLAYAEKLSLPQDSIPESVREANSEKCFCANSGHGSLLASNRTVCGGRLASFNTKACDGAAFDMGPVEKNL